MSFLLRRFLFGALLLLTGADAFSAPPPIIYVSPGGSDANSGGKARPFRTLMRAHDAIRAASSGKPGRIILQSGVYDNARLLLESRDSGLTIEAAPGAKPTLSGGLPVTGWERDGKFLSAKIEGVKEGTRDFRFFIVNGLPRDRARLPETGAYTHLSVFDVRWMSTSGGGWERKPTPEELNTMKYRKGDLGPWLDLRNAELTIYHAWDESLVGIKSLDDTTGTVTFSIPSGHPPGAFGDWMEKAKTYVVWNIREGMTRPGQWYLDRTNGRVVYWPLPGETAENIRAVAPVSESVILFAPGTRGVTLRGFTVSCTTTALVTGGFGAGNYAAAIQGDSLVACRFLDLTVKNTGGWGMKVNGDSLRAENCSLHHTGAGGVFSNGRHFLLSGCSVHDVGLTYPSAIAVWINGDDHIISHNEIYATPYSAFVGGGKRYLIESNRISNIMNVLDDGGAIYLFSARDSLTRGNVVRGGKPGKNAHAYYLDELSENCVVEGNLAVNVNWPTHNHMTKNCIYRNNIFIDSGTQLLTFPRSSGVILEHNIFSAGEITIQAAADGISSLMNNIFYSRSGKITVNHLNKYTTVGTEPLTARDGSVFADPRLEGVESGRIRFLPGSPAPRLGIAPIHVSGAGRERRAE